MDSAPSQTPINEHAALLEAAQAELARPGHTRRFPRTLAAKYEADRSASRCQELRRLSQFGAAGYVGVVLLVHLFVNPHPNLWAFLAQLVVIPPIIIFGMRRYARPEVSSFKREAMALSLCCLVVLGTMLDIAASSPDLVVMNMFVVIAPVIGCVFFARMTPVSAMVFVGFTAACLAVVTLGRADIPHEIRFYPLGIMLSAAAFALFALRELDAALRRLYLHGLVQTLRIADLAARNRSLDELSATDALTGAGNRRQFEKALAALKPSPNLSHFLFLIDIDHFKQLNDKFGHQTGDACLRAAVEIMSKMLRPGDTIARVGGDEFAILLIQSSLLDARRIADRLCGGVPSQGFEAEGRIHQMSVSIGCAEWDLRYDSDRFFSMADAALYHAKRAGKGRVFWAQPDVAERAANSVSDDGAENFAA